MIACRHSAGSHVQHTEEDPIFTRDVQDYRSTEQRDGDGDATSPKPPAPGIDRLPADCNELWYSFLTAREQREIRGTSWSIRLESLSTTDSLLLTCHLLSDGILERVSAYYEGEVTVHVDELEMDVEDLNQLRAEKQWVFRGTNVDDLLSGQIWSMESDCKKRFKRCCNTVGRAWQCMCKQCEPCFLPCCCLIACMLVLFPIVRWIFMSIL